jgi:hypothetical protein
MYFNLVLLREYIVDNVNTAYSPNDSQVELPLFSLKRKSTGGIFDRFGAVSATWRP